MENPAAVPLDRLYHRHQRRSRRCCVRLLRRSRNFFVLLRTGCGQSTVDSCPLRGSHANSPCPRDSLVLAPCAVGSETAPPGAPASACAVREDKHWIGIQARRGDRQNDDLFRDQLVSDEEAFPTGVIAGKSPKPAAVATHSNICRAMCVTRPSTPTAGGLTTRTPRGLA